VATEKVREGLPRYNAMRDDEILEEGYIEINHEVIPFREVVDVAESQSGKLGSVEL